MPSKPKRSNAKSHAMLMNTAIAIASDPARMAQAFKAAVEAGRAV